MSQLKNAAAVTLKGAPVAKLTIRGKLAWEKSRIINWLPRATDADRTTIYNGIGYKIGERLSSSGNVEASSKMLEQGMCTTGYIPAKPGDVLRISGFDLSAGTNYYIIAYDQNNTKTGHVVFSEIPSPHTAILTANSLGSNFNAIRFCARNLSVNTFVTLNQELP